jgi:hypothetical protein
MPDLRGFLDRFRPAGTPGRPTPVGVPADRAERAGAELAPVFASLAEAEVEAGRIRADAAAEAERRLEAARREAAALVEDARDRAPEVRAATAAAAVEAARARSAAAPAPDPEALVDTQVHARLPELLREALAEATVIVGNRS